MDLRKLSAELNAAWKPFLVAARQLLKDIAKAWKKFMDQVRTVPKPPIMIYPVEWREIAPSFDQDLVMKPLPGRPGSFSGRINEKRIIATFLDDEFMDFDPDEVDRVWDNIIKKRVNKS